MVREALAVLAFALVALAPLSAGSVEPPASSELSFVPMPEIPELEWPAEGWIPMDGSKAGGLVAVVAEQNLYALAGGSIDQYVSDLEGEGYEVVLDTSAWSGDAELRDWLASLLPSGLQGAVLIGDVPVPIFEMYEPESWGGEYAYFPCDLYYMDLDGYWEDTDYNDYWDFHDVVGNGTREPEIWVGRLYASSLYSLGPEDSLIQDYLDKAHLYREGNFSLPNEALVYVDDDWYDYADSWDSDVGLLYGTREFEKEPLVTTADDYAGRLSTPRDWVSLFAHSSTDFHAFKEGLGWSYLSNTGIDTIQPPAHFYNLFCCSAARYTASYNGGYIAGHYVFGQDYGLCAIGSSKTGSMLNFYDFYTPLDYGMTIGEAFKEWFAINGEFGVGEESRAWFYGMSIIGDPTLRPRETSPPSSPAELDISVVGQDIALDWSDATCADIDHYEVFKSSTPDGLESGVPAYRSNQSGQPLTSEWLDADALGSNPIYYAVRAVDTGRSSSPLSLVVAVFPVPVVAGWNLISCPVEPYHDSWDALLEDTAYSYCHMLAYADGAWTAVDASMPAWMRTGLKAQAGSAIWVEMDSAGVVNFAGTVPEETVIQLDKGWNLVGFPHSGGNMTFAGALSGIPYDLIQTSGLGPYGLADATPMDAVVAGRGYWIHATADCTLTVVF